ncbi:MAG: hypothetical protein IJ677_08180 [Alphaproteobacteria bacterium]|nr:hypothetical protein [Alphaproteobacteria bacterium]
MENYFEGCISIEGTVNVVLDDNASFTFMAGKVVFKNGKSVELSQPRELLYTAVPVIDNEPVYVGDNIRLKKNESGVVFPENLTRKAYKPVYDILSELNRDYLLSGGKVSITAVVDKVYVGFSDNVWLRLDAVCISTGNMCRNMPSLPVCLCINEPNGLFSNMSEKSMNTAKLALMNIKCGDEISVDMESFTFSEDKLQCNCISFRKKIGQVWCQLPASVISFTDISELWPK